MVVPHAAHGTQPQTATVRPVDKREVELTVQSFPQCTGIVWDGNEVRPIYRPENQTPITAGFLMRIWVTSLLWLSSLGLFAAAQQPRVTGDPPTIVIRPMRPGESTDKEPVEKSGFIVIRPNGKGTTTTQVSSPKQSPATAPSNPTPTNPPSPGVLNVPPPGPQPAAVAGKDGKPLFDYWFVVGIDGQRAGYVNWAAKEMEQKGKMFVAGVRYLNLTISRFGSASTQTGEESTVETPTGTVLITSMRQTLGKDQALALTGIVEGKPGWFKLTDQVFGALKSVNVPEPVLVKLHSMKNKELSQDDFVKEISKLLDADETKQFQNLVLTRAGQKLKVKRDGTAIGTDESEIPWTEGVVGIVREPRLFKELNLKIGESFDYPSYIPTVNWVVKTTITNDGEESKVLWPNTPARKLLRFTTKPAPIGKVKLPASTTWVDPETFEPLLLETDFPALGRLTFLRTTKEAANAPITRPVEVFNTQSIRLNREIPGIHTKGSVVYKVSVPRDDEPETVFASESRQQILNLDAKARTFELHVTASHGPDKNAPAQPAPGKEFIASNFFINWDNDLVKAHAAKAIAGLPANAGAWEKAVAVERWVKKNMVAFEFDQAMATADNVAKTLRGDCTEYAMLAAAMCRAVGVPSRTVLGVVYAHTGDSKTFMAYHMWYEVFADGQWLPLDATLGFGGVGPGHIKITDHSWYEERSFAPLLPVLRALCAKPSMEVLKVGP